MVSCGQFWAIGSISHLVYVLFAEAIYYRIPNNDRGFMDTNYTLVGRYTSQKYLRLLKSQSRHSWLPGLLISTSPGTHNVLPPTEQLKPSKALISLFVHCLELPHHWEICFFLCTQTQFDSWGMASSVNLVPNLACYDLWHPHLTFSPCLYVRWALQPCCLGFSGLSCFHYLGHRKWYHGSQEIFWVKRVTIVRSSSWTQALLLSWWNRIGSWINPNNISFPRQIREAWKQGTDSWCLEISLEGSQTWLCWV